MKSQAALLRCAAGDEAAVNLSVQRGMDLLGDPLESFICKDFIVLREPVKPFAAARNIAFPRSLITPKPVIDPGRCNQCGPCVRVCPAQPKAIDWHDDDKSKPPTCKYDRCIRCLCCPDLAISIKTAFLARLAQEI